MADLNDLQMIKKLRDAHIPPYVFRKDVNFNQLGLVALRDRIMSAEVAQAETPVNFYLHAKSDSRDDMRRTATAAALIARTFCITGKPVIHAHMAGFLREQRMAEMEREGSSVNPVLQRLGQGYIAISDFLEHADVQERYGSHSLQLIADYLMEHVEAGGGLILGATDIPLLDVIQFGAAFSNMLGMFESYRI